jgi:hypothetical protein
MLIWTFDRKLFVQINFACSSTCLQRVVTAVGISNYKRRNLQDSDPRRVKRL